jgi:histidinol-phosphate aminotransferase
LRDALQSLGLAVTPSQGNFLLADLGRDASALEAALLRRGVVPRPMRGYGLPDCLRLTVGLPDENARLFSALRDALREAAP